MDAGGTSTGIHRCFRVGGGNVDDSNNMSSDTTAPGANSLTGRSSSAQFVSPTGGAVNLHLISTSEAVGAGVDLVTTPTGVNIDIDGRDRDSEGDDWDMGADQFTEEIALASALFMLT
jgi:hypothetical protein